MSRQLRRRGRNRCSRCCCRNQCSCRRGVARSARPVGSGPSYGSDVPLRRRCRPRHRQHPDADGWATLQSAPRRRLQAIHGGRPMCAWTCGGSRWRATRRCCCQRPTRGPRPAGRDQSCAWKRGGRCRCRLGPRGRWRPAPRTARPPRRHGRAACSIRCAQCDAGHRRPSHSHCAMAAAQPRRAAFHRRTAPCDAGGDGDGQMASRRRH